MARHSRRDFLKMLGATSAALSIPAKATSVGLSPRAPSREPSPNIVLLLADDLSVPDLGSYGNGPLKRPTWIGLPKKALGSPGPTPPLPSVRPQGPLC